MTAITTPRAAEIARRYVLIGLLPALLVAGYLALAPYSAERKCHEGDFSAAFSSDFDVRRCNLVVKRFGADVFKLPITSLPFLAP